VQAVYSALQQLQTARTPFNITTGKRQYKNMLIRSLIIRTDPESEFTLHVIALCQEVIIVGSASTGAGQPNSDGTIDPSSASTSSANTSAGINPSSFPTSAIDSGSTSLRRNE
jgi:hypothetical protein